jgi:integrase/recombinase XerC
MTTLSDPVVDAHIAWMRLRRLSPETVRLRRTVLKLLAGHAGRPPLALTIADLDLWQRSLRVSPASRRAYVVQTCGFYSWATGPGGLREDDPSTVLIRPQVPRGRPRPICEADLADAIAAAPQPVRCWLELAAYQGLRACECAWMERPDILEDDRLLIVRGKGSKERIIPLGATGLAALREHGLPRSGRVFRLPDGRDVQPVYVSKRCNDHLHELGIEATLHQCRHRFATRLLEEPDTSLREVQEALGHASPATTAIYTLVSRSRLAAAVEGLDRLRRPS